jgi:hypothetical protein
MRSAGGIVYEEAAKDVVVREIQGVPIRLADILEVMRRMSADQAAHRRNRWAEALRRAKDWEQLDK